jgi:hypothetical protein
VGTDWERIGGGEHRGRKWMIRSGKSSWEGEQWIIEHKKEGKGRG